MVLNTADESRPDLVEADAASTRQPRALYVLFLVEMWERFNYYGLQALVTLYMTKLLFQGQEDKFVFAIYGAYTALVYATPVIGGMLADRLLGYRRAVYIGGLFMAAGEFCMMVPQQAFFFTALALISVGNGFFKPNISSMVGQLYGENDPRRDSGFTIFYMGINLGAFLAPLLCGFVGQTYGWHYGFMLAGLGMLAGLVVLKIGEGELGDTGLAPSSAAHVPPQVAALGVPLGALLAVPVLAVLIRYNDALAYFLPVFSVIVLAYLVVTAFASEREERDRLLVCLVLIVFSVMFWAFFFQAGSSITLFTERNVDRHVFGWEIPASMFQSVNAIFIVLLAPVFTQLWMALERRGLNPSTPFKFALAILVLGLGFGVFVLGARLAASTGMVMLAFLVLGYMLHTVGELCLSPVGLSMVTKLSPAKIVGMVMGTWFLSLSFANYLAGMLAALTNIPKDMGAAGNPLTTLPIYADVFGKVALVAIAVGLVLLVLSPVLRKGMHGVK